MLEEQRFRKPTPPVIDFSILRQATWDEKCVWFDCADKNKRRSTRSVKPLGIVYVDLYNCLLACCLLREDFRAFRLDRMVTLAVTDESFRPHRVSLLREHLDLIRADAETSAIDRKAWD